MAMIRKLRRRWQAQVRRRGMKPRCKSFDSKLEAEKWARDLEAQVDRFGAAPDTRILESTTLSELLERYKIEVSPTKRGSIQEIQRIDVLKRHDIAYRRCHRGPFSSVHAGRRILHPIQDPSMSAVLDIIASAGLWAAVLRIATPLIFGTLGALLCERAGVLNLGIEGIMTFGAMIGWLAVYNGADLWTGFLLAALAGGVFGLLHAGLTVTLGLSQHVAGLGVTLFAGSFSYFVFRLAVPVAGTPPTITPFQPIAIPGLSDLSFVGPAFFTQTPPTYLVILLALVLAYIVFRTPLGLAIRMTGENPHAAEAQGINPMAVRYGAVIIGSALMGMAGAFLTLSAFNSFFPTMVQGRGWICIALVVFASWRPERALFGALLFAFFDGFQLRLQTVLGGAVPYQLFLMIPYILSIAALAVMARRARVPQALMQPYRRGER